MKNLKGVILAVSVFAVSSFAQNTIDMYKSPTCGCCTKWAEVMQNSGFKVNQHLDSNAIQLKARHNVPLELSSCHTAVVDGYIVEGHVPADEVKRLLELKPVDVVGISVPGMPLESPGMEQNSEPELYDVILFKKDGSREIFATYIGNKKLK